MMATWGTYYLGWHTPKSKDAPLEAGKVYQGKCTTAIDIPDNFELPIIKAMLQLRYQEPTAQLTYVYVKGRTVIYQWYQKSASPITAGGVFLVLVGLTLLVLAIGLVLVTVTKVEGIPATLGLSSSTLIIGGAIILIVIVFVYMLLPALRKKPEEKVRAR